jgi:hypothetical protein
MKKVRTETPGTKIFKTLNREEQQSITGGDGGGLLAFPFIQTAMQGAIAPVEPVAG